MWISLADETESLVPSPYFVLILSCFILIFMLCCNFLFSFYVVISA